MGWYPIVVDMTERPVLVVGGGAVAERKVEGLLAAGARVTVLAPDLTARLLGWVGEGRVRHVVRAYRPGDLAGYRVAFAATDDGAVNADVAREARERAVWLNAADDAGRSDFILPSVLRRGEIVVAVTTGGASPALARAVREELEDHVTEDHALLASVVAEVRGAVRREPTPPDAEAWRRAIADGGLRRLVAEGRRDEAMARLRARLGTSA
jgi:siroheme synthase-like protein